MRYRILDPPVAVTMSFLGERFDFDAEGPEAEPKSDREEAALEHLVSIGLAERVTKPAGGSRRSSEE